MRVLHPFTSLKKGRTTRLCVSYFDVIIWYQSLNHDGTVMVLKRPISM